MLLKNSNKHFAKILLLLAFAWGFHFTLSFENQAFLGNKASNSALENIIINQDAIVPASECNLVLSPISFQYSLTQEDNNTLSVALSTYNLSSISKYSQYLQCLYSFCKLCSKADLLYPFHYFW